jgi:hypothetical protein
MIGTHTVYVYPDRSDDPSGPFVDVSCLIDEVALIHGRADAQSQPVASSATINLTVGPGAPLPAEVEIGAWVVIATTVGATTSTRFVGRSGEIRYADAEHRRGITVAQDLDSCDLLVTPTWLRSLAGLVNDVRMTYGVTDTEAGTEQATYHGVNETSKTKFGRYEYSTTVELADAVDAVAATNLILTLNGAPVWMLQELPIDVAGLPAADTSTILGLEVHTLIRVNGFPVTGSTPTAVVAWVEGWTERLAFGVHDLTMIVSDYCRTVPPPRWNDHADLGHDRPRHDLGQIGMLGTTRLHGPMGLRPRVAPLGSGRPGDPLGRRRKRHPDDEERRAPCPCPCLA